jgi:hypothetical protein
MRRFLALLLILPGTAAITRSQPSFPDNGQLYVDTVVPAVYIEIHPDTLTWIYANPNIDKEFRATFVFDNGTVRDTVEQVGFRLRGNTSRSSMKKSFKVSFNTFTPGGKYSGVEKINLNGEHNDPSVMRSKIMWDILRKWNIPAPRANHVRVYINGSYYGLYINVEHIDEEFALSRFGNKDGNLFKCLYPADLAYRGIDPDNYRLWTGSRWTYELKTNLEENDFSDLAELINILHNTDNQNLVCEIDRVFNVQDYLKIMAVQIFCGDWDGYLYNKNNFYLYHNTLTDRFEYIPYDVDNTFGIDWFRIDWAERNIYTWQPGGDQVRPLYDRIVNNPVLRDQFSFYAGQLIADALDTDSLVAAIEARKEMIYPFIVNDPYYRLDYGYDATGFLNSFTSATGGHVRWGLYPYIEARKRSMSAQLEEGDAAPVIKYYTWDRRAGEVLRVLCTVEAAAGPVTARLVCSVAGGASVETEMTREGDGRFSVTLSGVRDEDPVTFQVLASGGNGVTSLLPCKPVMIAPVAGETPLLFINEFMADNEEVVSDENGSYGDWIEIFNGGDEPVSLGDLYLTDNFNDPLKWKMPGTVLPAGGFILFWADGTPGSGVSHTSFRLDKDGEEIGIFSSYKLVIDTVTFGIQSEDVSMGRKIDGADEIIFLPVATPGRSNNPTSAGPVTGETVVRIYPNPVTGAVLWLSEATDCRVYNARGILMFSGREVSEIDVSAFPAGVYILVTGNGGAVRFIRTGR